MQASKRLLDDYSATLWTLYAKYDLRPGQRLAVLHGQRGTYRLNDPAVRSQMFKDLLRVKGDETAVSWLLRYGHPFSRSMPDLVDLEDITLAANTAQWLWSLHKAVKIQDYPLLTQWKRDENDFRDLFKNRTVFPELDAECDDFEQDSDHGRLDDNLGRCDQQHAEQPSDPDGNLRHSALVQLARQYGRSIDPEKTHVLFSPAPLDQWRGIYWPMDWGGSELGLTPVPLKELVVSYSRRVWQSDPSYLVKAAQSYLSRALDYLLTGIHPSMEWRTYRGEARLVPILKVGCPLHVINLSLYQHICTMVPSKKCANPSCDEIIAPKRRDQRFCDRPGCRKWASRQRKRRAE